MKRGFTLIELLVVVLIIGILSAVALPKYQKAVKRAQGVEARVAIKMWTDALNIYYLENGVYPDISYTTPLEDATSLLGITVSPLKYFGVGCSLSMTSPVNCINDVGCGSSCGIHFHPKSEIQYPETIFCSIKDGKSINFDECGSTVGYSTEKDYGIKQ